MSEVPSSSHSRAAEPRFRFSIATMVLWSVAAGIVLALPRWFGEHAVQYSFYGTVGFIAWRLSRVMPIIVASLIAVFLGIIVSVFLITVAAV